MGAMGLLREPLRDAPRVDKTTFSVDVLLTASRSREDAGVLLKSLPGGTVNNRVFAFFQTIDGKYRNLPSLLFLVALTMVWSLVPPAYAGTGKHIPNNTPPYASPATSLGREDGSKIIDVAIWLQPHNRSVLDELAEDLYNPASPNYRHC